MKICNLVKIGTINRCVKNRLQILNRLWKNEKMSGPLGGIFLTHTVLCLYFSCVDWDNLICQNPQATYILVIYFFGCYTECQNSFEAKLYIMRFSLALKHVGLQICVRWYWKSQLHRPTMCCLLLCCFTLQHYRHTSVYCCFLDATKALIELNTVKFSNVYETSSIILLSLDCCAICTWTTLPWWGWMEWFLDLLRLKC